MTQHEIRPQAAAKNDGGKHQPVLILGMHRSGTSCLAGSLEEAGLHLGDVNTYAGFNKKGNRENLELMKLHDRVLARIGHAWNNPPAIAPAWTDQEKQELAAIVASFPVDRPWGQKDPRTLYMLDGWQSLSQPRYIGTFRHPVAVMSSLVHRAKMWAQPMGEDAAFGLWEAYNRQMLRVHQQQKFDLIRFDIAADLYHEKVRGAAEKLGLELSLKPAFREESLHNHRTDKDVPESLRKTWEALLAIAL